MCFNENLQRQRAWCASVRLRFLEDLVFPASMACLAFASIACADQPNSRNYVVLIRAALLAMKPS